MPSEPLVDDLLAEVAVRTSTGHHHWTGDYRLMCSDSVLCRSLAAALKEQRARAERAETQLAAARTVIRHHIFGAVRLSHIDRGVEWVYPDGATAPITHAEATEIHAATNQPGEGT